MLIPLLSIAFALAPFDSEVGVITTGGEVVSGTLASFRVEMTTTFGTATIDSDTIVSIKFGETDVVETLGESILRGTLDLSSIRVQAEGGTKTIRRAELNELRASRHAELEAGEITSGIHWNGSKYDLRAPQSFRPGRDWPALVFLHGTNSNTEMFIRRIAARWPEIGKNYVLIGVNGITEGERSTPELRRYLYEFVNFAGRSNHPVARGTERQSPLMVAEVVRDLKARLPIGTTFVSGHSMGGYMTYSTFMNYPELFDGAIPSAGGMTKFCQPPGYTDQKLRAAQRAVPVAVVHASNDEIVLFEQAEEAQKFMAEAGFANVKLFTNDQANHTFLLLPFNEAVRWLETVTGLETGG